MAGESTSNYSPWGPISMMVDPLSIFASIGVLVVVPQLKRLSSFIWFHFLRPTSWQIYLHGPNPYALITGATDGIGKGIAKDLYRKGFNLILHGRNEAKMNKVVEELKALDGKTRGDGDIKVFLADAKEDGHDFQAIAKKYEGLDITVVVNNVGGMTPRDSSFDEWTEREHTEIVRCNVLFPTFLTRALLPGLRKTARRQPVLVVFIGSIAGSITLPRLPLYSASKTFLNRLTGNLHMDERFHGSDSKVSFMYLEVGLVNSGSIKAPVSWTCPAADEFAKSAVQSFGSGKRVVAPYIGHAVVSHLASYLPEGLSEILIRQEMKKTIELMGKTS